MTITRHSSGNLNDIRAYPLADTANRRASDGSVMPESIINDCHIWWPDSYGTRAFISAVTASPALITVVIAARHIAAEVNTPIAVMQILRPEVPYRSYPVTGLVAGVGGWLAPGNLPDEMTGINTWQFDTYANSELIYGLAQSYPAHPIRTVGRHGSQEALDGTVKFLAGTNMSIKEGYRYIDGLFVRCIVFSLNEEQLPGLYEYFAGDCGKRPESRTCDWNVVRSINGVTPDCDGIIYIDIPETGVLYAAGDKPTGETAPHGLTLFTPAEYGDVCYEIVPFPVLPDDICSSSSGFTPVDRELVWVSSSSYMAIVEPPVILSSSSSAFPAREASYDFSDSDQIKDWSPFLYNGNHFAAWNWNPVGFHLARWRVNELDLPIPRNDTQRGYWWNNAYKARMSADSEFEIDTSLSLDINMLNAITGDVHLGLAYANEVVTPEYAAGGYGVRLQLVVSKIADNSFSFSPRFQHVTPALSAWTDIAGAPANDYGHDQVIWGLLSSSGFACGVNYSSSSSGRCVDKLNFTMRFKVTQLSGSSSSAAPAQGIGGSFGYLLEYQIGNAALVTYEFWTEAGAYDDMQFFGIAQGYTGSDPTFPEQSATWRTIRVTGTNLSDQTCEEEDFVGLYAAQTRLEYFLKYDPELVVNGTAGWVNDFGTGRAMNQWSFSQRQYFSTPSPQISGSRGELTLPHQTLMISGPAFAHAAHKYAICNCQQTAAAAEDAGYVFTVCFRMLPGSDDTKYGIALGYNAMLGGLPNVFWAFMLWPASNKCAYGMHWGNVGGQRFAPDAHQDTIELWTSLSSAFPDATAQSGWQYEWHRLMVRVASGSGGYSIRAWLSPYDLRSSSALGPDSSDFYKTVYYNQGNPGYHRTMAEVSGTPDFDDFANGPAGLYAFEGEVRAAEFAIAPWPGRNDLLLPLKQRWLWHS